MERVRSSAIRVLLVGVDDVWFVWPLYADLRFSGHLNVVPVQAGCDVTLKNDYRVRLTVFIGPIPVESKSIDLTTNGALERQYLDAIDMQLLASKLKSQN